MLRICAIHARSGMRLATPIYHPNRPATILLRTGAELTDLMIAKLRDLGIQSMWIAYPGLEEIAAGVSEEVTRARAGMTQTLADAFGAARETSDPELDYRSFRDAITALLDALIHNPHAAQHVRDMSDCPHPILRAGANAAYISILIGLKLDFYLERQRSRLSPAQARDVSALGMGALLHDVGALALEPEVRDHYIAMRDENDPAWREHVLRGFEMVRGKIDAAAATVVLHHHQRYDGSGYPARKTTTGIHTPAGDDIHIFARIVGAADLFESLRSPPSRGEQPVPVVRALSRLMRPPYSDWIDPVVLLGLLTVIPPYAPGTVVELNNGLRGVVTRWHPEEPCRPVVREIPSIEAPSDEFTGEEFDLLVEPELEIARTDGEDVAADNFYASGERRFNLQGVARTLINRAAEEEARVRDSA
jgi:HD-GYP domain-containing protein (c-di-GMP phosphodiesterase class II)